MGNYYLTLYGFEITHRKDRFFTIGNDNKRKKFCFIPSPVMKEKVSSTPIDSMAKQPSALATFINPELKDASINEKLYLAQKEQLCKTRFQFRDPFATADKPLGAIIGHEVHHTLTTETLSAFAQNSTLPREPKKQRAPQAAH